MPNSRTALLLATTLVTMLQPQSPGQAPPTFEAKANSQEMLQTQADPPYLNIQETATYFEGKWYLPNSHAIEITVNKFLENTLQLEKTTPSKSANEALKNLDFESAAQLVQKKNVLLTMWEASTWLITFLIVKPTRHLFR